MIQIFQFVLFCTKLRQRDVSLKDITTHNPVHMSQTARPNLRLIIPERKDVDIHETEPSPNLKKLSTTGSLTPDLTPASPPTFPQNDNVLKIGKYLLVQGTDTQQLQSGITIQVHRALHTETGEESVCKVSIWIYYNNKKTFE